MIAIPLRFWSLMGFLALSAFCALSAGCQKKPLPASQSQNVQNELLVCYKVMLLGMRLPENKGAAPVDDKVPGFSSKAVPSWATTEKLPDLFPDGRIIGSDRTMHETLKAAYNRPWTYRVPPALVGVTRGQIKETEIVIEIADAPATLHVKGITYEGKFVEG